MSESLFNLLGDLAAETWYKVESRWKTLNKPPLQFRPGAGLSKISVENNFIPFYAPVDLKLDEAGRASNL